jgi:hypothetical protein
MTTTITGLRRGGAYVIWLDVGTRNPVDGLIHDTMVGRSTPITVG